MRGLTTRCGLSRWDAAALAVLVALILALLLLGCERTPQRRFLDAVDGYNAAASVYLSALDAGRIPDEALPELEMARKTAWSALMRWEAALADGRGEWVEVVGEFNRALGELVRQLGEAQRREP